MFPSILAIRQLEKKWLILVVEKYIPTFFVVENSVKRPKSLRDVEDDTMLCKRVVTKEHYRPLRTDPDLFDFFAL